MIDTIIISDIHIGRNDSNCEQCLELIKNNPSKEIILNGDIFDQQYAFKDRFIIYKNKHSKIVKEFLALIKKRNTKVTYLIGNHDYFMFLLMPFSFLFNIKIRKRIKRNNVLFEHGDWIKFRLKLINIFKKKKIKIYDKDHENFFQYAKYKKIKFVVGHSHEPGIIGDIVYDSGDWVGNNTYLSINNNLITLRTYESI